MKFCVRVPAAMKDLLLTLPPLDPKPCLLSFHSSYSPSLPVTYNTSPSLPISLSRPPRLLFNLPSFSLSSPQLFPPSTNRQFVEPSSPSSHLDEEGGGVVSFRARLQSGVQCVKLNTGPIQGQRKYWPRWDKGQGDTGTHTQPSASK